jgi:hypothetical protein
MTLAAGWRTWGARTIAHGVARALAAVACDPKPLRRPDENPMGLGFPASVTFRPVAAGKIAWYGASKGGLVEDEAAAFAHCSPDDFRFKENLPWTNLIQSIAENF